MHVLLASALKWRESGERTHIKSGDKEVHLRRSISAAMAAGLLLVAGFGAFGAVRLVRGGNGSAVAEAQPVPPGQPVSPSPTPTAVVPTNLPANPDTTKQNWFVPYLDAERTKPMFDQTINGITVGPSAEHRPSVACKPGTARQAPLTEALTTPVTLTPKYLPAGANQFEALATVCETAAGQTVVIGADVGISIPSDPKSDRRGGVVSIARWQGAPSATVAIAAERWSAGTVAGHPAAIAEPILANGLGQSAVVVYANGVVTKVQASWLTLAEVKRIAEGLFC